MDRRLFDICSSQPPKGGDQRKLILGALKDGANVNGTDKNGVTALHFAVRFRCPEAVKALIECSANVNQSCCRTGSTPLHRAVIQTGAPGTAGKTEAARHIIKLLLAAGADPSIPNKRGKRPVDYVSDSELKLLLRVK